jgi:hypothetical protein
MALYSTQGNRKTLVFTGRSRFLVNEYLWVTAEVSVLIDSLLALKLYIAAIYFLTN